MLRRSFDQETVDDNGRQRHIDQDITQRFTSFNADLSVSEKQKTDAGKQQHLQNLLYEYLFDNAPPLFRFWIISLPVSVFLARPFHLRNTYIGKTGNAVDSRIPGGNPVRSFGAAAGISGNRTGGADHAGENVQYRTILVHKAFPLHVDCMFG